MQRGSDNTEKLEVASRWNLFGEIFLASSFEASQFCHDEMKVDYLGTQLKTVKTEAGEISELKCAERPGRVRRPSSRVIWLTLKASRWWS